MGNFARLLCVVVATYFLYCSCCGKEFEEELEDDDHWPAIGVTILVRDKAHSLPFALEALDRQDYPQNRMFVWFYVDNTKDKSLEIINEWANVSGKKYHKIYVNTGKGSSEVLSSTKWTEKRLKHLIKLREKALKFARGTWAKFLFMMDADVLLADRGTLKSLISKDLLIVAPMLLSDGLYSNFWGAMTKNYLYQRSQLYEDLMNNVKQGCFSVPIVHTAVVINLRMRATKNLTYDPSNLADYDGPVDDVVAFATSAKQNNISINVCNDRLYGFVPIPVDLGNTLMKTTEEEQLLNVRVEALSMGQDFPPAPELEKFAQPPEGDNLGLDSIFMINLERRVERRQLMLLSFLELGIECEYVKAVDGRNLNMDDLSALGIRLMPNYEDPYHKRAMKAGEVGCFLSHFQIWKEIARRHIKTSLILEDDIHFTPYFRRRFEELLADLKTVDWELVYIGRKALMDNEERILATRLVKPQYSYWTLGYLISEAGARKLIRAEPLTKMLPVDEFLPIMFDQHPNDTWKSYFPQRDLKAYSADPLLVYPTHYTGQNGYISDTEDSPPLVKNRTEFEYWSLVCGCGLGTAVVVVSAAVALLVRARRQRPPRRSWQAYEANAFIAHLDVIQ